MSELYLCAAAGEVPVLKPRGERNSDRTMVFLYLEEKRKLEDFTSSFLVIKGNNSDQLLLSQLINLIVLYCNYNTACENQNSGIRYRCL